MGDKEGLDLRGIFDEEADIRDNDVNTQQLFVGKHQTGIDDNHLVPVAKDHHIHSKLTEAT
jgi:hypothetical protein